MALICAGGLTLVNDAEAVSVSISGTFTSDFTLIKNNSPYNLTGNIIIAEGATLTIEPGVTVNMGFYRIDVNGTLNAKGTSTDKIVFQTNNQWFLNQIRFLASSSSWNEQTGQGCIIENAILNCIAVNINGASPKIADSQISHRMEIRGGSPIIINNNISLSGEDGVEVISGIPTILGNTIVGNGFGMGIYGSGSPVIVNNFISTFDVGIETHLGNFQITDNVITGCRVGILVTSSGTIPIRRNLINNNTEYGISGGNALIDSNTITNNKIGIHNPDYGSIISNNNILGNSVNSITTAAEDIDATNNWWGTTDLDVINQMIYDKKDDPALGEVAFMPIANSSIQRAPEIPELIYPVPTFDPSINPTPSGNVEPTPRYTPMPTVEPDKPKTGRDQSSPFYSLNLLVVAVAIPLVIAWLIVILSYSLKAKISSLKEDIKS